eukprot:1179348-Prorocentrum_minimum.AAC.3
MHIMLSASTLGSSTGFGCCMLSKVVSLARTTGIATGVGCTSRRLWLEMMEDRAITATKPSAEANQDEPRTFFERGISTPAHRNGHGV